LAAARLDDEACPRDNMRSAIISPQMQAVLVDALKGLFHESTEIEKQYKDGTMGRTLGLKFSMDQNVRNQLVASYTGGTPIVTVAGQSGNSVLTSGWPNSTLVLNQGDIVTFDKVFAVNPQNKQA